MQCEFINPLQDPNWDATIRQFQHVTVFHSSFWAQVLASAYGYTPCYGTLKDDGRIRGVLPLMEVNSVWTGKRAMSLPFSDECPPLVANDGDRAQLLESAFQRGRQKGWRYLEWRGGDDARGATVSEEFLVHRLTLASTADLQLRKLRDSTRRNIQKSEREGVEVEYRQGSDAMEAFYALHCQTRRRHGLPPQPARFFRLIQKLVLEPGHGFLSLARFNRRWIAGAVYFQFGSHAIYKFGASDPRFQNLRANNRIMWDAICRLQKDGVRELSFGRTDIEDEGLLQFKRGWGAQESPLRYYRLNFSKDEAPAKPQVKHEGTGWSRHIMRRLPIPVLRVLGTLVYRHVA